MTTVLTKPPADVPDRLNADPATEYAVWYQGGGEFHEGWQRDPDGAIQIFHSYTEAWKTGWNAGLLRAE